MMARVAPFSELVAKPLRLLFKVIARARRSHIDSFSCVKATAPAAVLQIAQECAPIPSQPSDLPLVQDNDYYKSDDSTDGFCLFKVENALFRVHRFVLARDSSAFEAMFKLPRPRVVDEKQSAERKESGPVSLTDTAEQFRDLLWALYALPNDLHPSNVNNHEREDYDSSTLPLNRLLNIAEMAHKYSFASFETWALSHIYRQGLESSGPLHIGSSVMCVRILNIAMLTGHQKLSELCVDALVTRLLDFSSSKAGAERFDLAPILAAAQKHGLHKLRGLSMYRYLIMNEMEDKNCKHSSPQLGLDFKPRPLYHDTPKRDTPIINRVSYLSAHYSLVNLWEYIRNNPPPVECSECDTHDDCVACWRTIWTQAAQSAEALEKSSADVLGRLKCMDKILRRSLWTNTSIPLVCALAALESCANVRDVLINNLSDFFEAI